VPIWDIFAPSALERINFPAALQPLMDSHLRPLLHKAGVVVMMMVVMMVYNYHHLRLRRDRYREADGKRKSIH